MNKFTLVIAEKPSLGRSIAEALDKNFSSASGGGALEGNGIVVSWLFGHILELAPLESYNPAWKSWDHRTLPIRIDDWQYQVKEPKQLKIIENYLKNASEVIHAGDPDREGQLLVDEVLDYLKWRGRTKRLLPHATDKASILKAWGAMRSNEEFHPLYQAGMCRQRADFLVGLNTTRAATQLATVGGALVPIGRVMTPTLGLVVRRDLEIENFVPQAFWKIAADVQTGCGKQVRLVHDPKERITDPALAKKIASQIKGATVDLEVKKEKKTERSPLPWHLGDFQREMQKRFGWKLTESLQVLQVLYEKKLASYPRTECRYLPEEQASEAAAIAKKHAALALQGEKWQQFDRIASKLAPKGWVYDNSKVAEHHGIIPTMVSPSSTNIGEREMLAWKALVEHFCKTLMPNHEYMETVISFKDGDGRTFSLSGKASLNWEQSWRSLEPRSEDANLPSIDVLKGTVMDTEMIQGKTTPPERYTEASLSGDMESVAKFATDERIKAKLKETSGIGTAATRAPTIEKLKRYGMLEESKKSDKGKKGTSYIVSTPFGREVIKALPSSIKDAALTATWEDALTMITEKKFESKDFMEKIDGYVGRIIDAIRGMPPNLKIREIPNPPKQTAAPAKTSKRTTASKSTSKPSSKRASTTSRSSRKQ